MAAKQGMQIAVAELLNDEKMTGTAQHSRRSLEHPERSVSMAATFGSFSVSRWIVLDPAPKRAMSQTHILVEVSSSI